MQKASVEEEQHIKTLIREYLNGQNKDFEKIRYTLYDYAYILTKPVFKDDQISGHIAEHILKKLEDNLDKIKTENDFFSWFSLFCVYRMYRIIDKNGSGIEECDHQYTYQHDTIGEDKLLAVAANRYFDWVVTQNKSNPKDHLTTTQRLLLEMYALLELDVRKIARLCKTEPECIQSEIAIISQMIVTDEDRAKVSALEEEQKNVSLDSAITQESVQVADIPEKKNTDAQTMFQETFDEGKKIALVDILFPSLSKRTRMCIDVTAGVAFLLTILVALI